MLKTIAYFIHLFEMIVLCHHGLLGMIMGLVFVILESIFPFLPLAFFITMNMIAFGNLVGFLLSWLGTLLGCSISYFLFRKLGITFFTKLCEKKVFKTILNKINHLSFTGLVLIMAIPFTPAFFINIAAGLSNVKYIKFILAASIAKIILIYFWGFIGTSFLESVTNIEILFKLTVFVFISFLLSKFVVRKLNIE